MPTNVTNRSSVARVAVIDYPGHPFQLELSRSLAGAGYAVLHLYSPDVASGKGRVKAQACDPPLFEVEAVSIEQQIARYDFSKRAKQEFTWGRLVLKRVKSWKTDVVIFSNVPLLAQVSLVHGSRKAGLGLVLWQQDVHSRAVADVVVRKLGPVGRIVATGFGRAERRCARRCHAVVTIADEFVPVLKSWGVGQGKITVQPNWAPLDEIVPTDKVNQWSLDHRLDDRPVVMYAGTLSFKHNPRVLLHIARTLQARGDKAVLVVVTEGLGRDYLQSKLDAEPELPMILLDFQPYDELVKMLGTADILVALLEKAAGSFSVPSKILTYLCAGRPIVAAVPVQNQAAALLQRSGAASVVDTEDVAGAVAAVQDLLSDPTLANRRGDSGRQFAEQSFNIKTIWPRFAQIVETVNSTRRVAG